MVCVFRAVVSQSSVKPITEVLDASDLKNGSSKTYAEAMKELTFHQQSLDPQSGSSELQWALLDHEASISYVT